MGWVFHGGVPGENQEISDAQWVKPPTISVVKPQKNR
jgi:hypothetical protein